MRMQELTNITYGRWPGILVSLGADDKYLVKKHGPCPFCGGKDRFIYKDDGVGKWFCNQCGHGDGWDYLSRLRGWTLREAMDHVAPVAGVTPPVAIPKQDPLDKMRYMRKIWTESKTVEQGDPVWRYLNNRGLVFKTDAIRYHPSLRHSVDGGSHPAMIAKMISPDGTRAIGLHRTYLTLDGQKAEVNPVRKSFGEIGAIRLACVETALGIAEGIETALGATMRYGTPTWAATCAHGLESFLPPSGVSRVEVYGDCDASYTGQAAAYALAMRLVRDGYEVVVRIPEQMGTDWADFTKEPT